MTIRRFSRFSNLSSLFEPPPSIPSIPSLIACSARCRDWSDTTLVVFKALSFRHLDISPHGSIYYGMLIISCLADANVACPAIRHYIAVTL